MFCWSLVGIVIASADVIGAKQSLEISIDCFVVLIESSASGGLAMTVKSGVENFILLLAG